MSEVMFPSLSEDGWVTSSQSIGDYLFAHFFLSDYSQTQLYPNEVSSLAWIIREKQNDLTQMTSLIRSTLERYFSRYFTNVVVEVDYQEDKENPSKIALTLYVKYTDSLGKEIVLGKLIEVIDSKIDKVVKLNNG